MTKYESYSSRYARQEPRSRTPNPIGKGGIVNDQTLSSQINAKASKIEVSFINQRLLEMENKMMNLTNIVKLVQKYTQTQDIQFQKQKKMYAGKESVLNVLIADYEQFMRKKEQHLYEIEQTHRQLKNQSLSAVVQELSESIRKQMNMKIQICMNQMRNYSVQNSSSYLRGSQKDVGDMQYKLEKLEQEISSTRYASKKELASFKKDVDQQIVHVVDKFTKLVKKYIATQPLTPIKSISKSPKNKLELPSNPNFSIDKPTVRNLNKNESQQNIHPNKTDAIKSKSKSKQVSIKKSITRQNSPKPNLKISDKRRQKEQQLKNMLKKSKDKRALLR